MAFDIKAQLFGHFIAHPEGVVKLNDLTATSAWTRIGADTPGAAKAATWFLTMVYQKAFTAGTGTAGPVYEVEVADDSAGTNLVRIGAGQVQRADEQSAFVIGFAPIGAKKYVRVKLTLSGTDTATYDALIVGVP